MNPYQEDRLQKQVQPLTLRYSIVLMYNLILSIDMERTFSQSDKDDDLMGSSLNQQRSAMSFLIKCTFFCKEHPFDYRAMLILILIHRWEARLEAQQASVSSKNPSAQWVTEILCNLQKKHSHV